MVETILESWILTLDENGRGATLRSTFRGMLTQRAT